MEPSVRVYAASPRRSRGAGFSLVEVMVALAILFMVGAAVFTSLVRLQRNASENRNYACAQIILRNAIDQALTRGWIDINNPNGILAPTLPGSTSNYDASNGGWAQWNPFTAADTTAPDSVVPVYADQLDPTRNVSGKLFRKIQRVKDNPRLLWVTLRLDYNYSGKAFSQQMSSVRSLD